MTKKYQENRKHRKEEGVGGGESVLNVEDLHLLTIMRWRTDLPELDLAFRFKIS